MKSPSKMSSPNAVRQPPTGAGRERLRRFSSEDLQKHVGLVQEAALIEPVEITYHGRARHILMSVSEYRRLREAPPPVALHLSEIPNDILAELANAEMAPHDDDIEQRE